MFGNPELMLFLPNNLLISNMSASKKLVYIVDDDPMQVQMMSDHLEEKFPFDVRGFSTGEEAVNNLPNNPDIVVLDYYLNSVQASARNGSEILQFIKKEFPNMQVIMVSGQDSMEVAVDTMRYGAADYVIKGGNQFIRLEHAIEKIFASDRMHQRVNYYRRLSIFSIAALLVIVALTIILSATGVI